MKFKNEQHEKFYMENIHKTNSVRGPYRKALFYALVLTEQTRTYLRTFTISMKKGLIGMVFQNLGKHLLHFG